MKLHLLTLKFSGESSKLEAPFLSDYYRRALTHIRMSLILCALLYASFASLDVQRMPEQKYTTTWLIRFVIVCPALFATLLASFSKSFERYMQPLLAGVFILVGGGIICMMFIDTPHVPYTGLLLVYLWGYTLVRIRFLWASLAGWVLVALYEIAAIWISPTPFAVLLNNNIFFISANVVGMLACYSIEFYARRDFFLTQQLEIEREKVYKVNQELEERVERRTADYQIINRTLEKEITAHKRAEEALRESERKYRFMTDNAADIIWTVDMNLNFTYISPSVQRLRGLTVEEAMSQKVHEVLTPASLQHALKVMEEESKTLMSNPDRIRDKLTIELEEYCKDGSTIWTENELKYLPGEDGKPIGIIGVTRDISERKQAEKALRESNEQYQTLVENASDIVFRTNATGHFTFVNAAAIRISGYKEEEVIGRHYPTLVRPDMVDDATRFFGRQFVKKLQNTYSEYPIITKDGQEVWIGQNTQLIMEDGNVTGFQAVSRDITERKRLEKELRDSEERYRELSIIDDLTQLYNSRYFYHQLKTEIDRLARYEHPLTLLLLDLDNFKAFNDAYGHIEGDQVLLRLGQVIKRCLRKTDSAYRYGGEEFTIILPITTRKEGTVTAERIIAELKKENFSPVPGKHVHITVSIGLAQYKKKEDMKAFVHRVDQLMYRGKKNGKDRVCSE